MSRGGRRYGKHHLPVESCHSLSSWGYFQRAQMWSDAEDDLEFFWDGDEKRAVIRFTRNGREHSQEIALIRTPCHYGGVRCWFQCPNCRRRVGKVYLPCSMYVTGGIDRVRVVRFLCRHCYSLTYLQRQDRDLYWVMIHRADRIAEHWLGEVTKDFIYKRKGQHWETFNKRFEERERAIAFHNAAGWVGIGKIAERNGWKF